MSKVNSTDVLMLFLEPAPYIVGFVNAVRERWPGRVDALYVARSATQEWDYAAFTSSNALLPPQRPLAIKEIYRRLTSGRYKILHLAAWGHVVLLAALFIARMQRIPVVVESDSQAAYCEPAWKRFLKRVVYTRLLRLPAIFLPGGSRQVSYLSSYGVPESKILISHMTVDVKRIAAYSQDFFDKRKQALVRHGLQASTVRFLYLGRLEPHKGLADLLAAFSSLKKECPHVRLLVAGWGSIKNEITSAAAADSDIHYFGRLSGEAVWEAYNLADVFVLPSHFEPWGLVVNEAMAAGLPTIVTDRVGCGDDLVRPGVTGIVVPAKNPHALRDALKMLAENSELRSKMANEARRHIAGWTLENQAAATVSAWEQALLR